MLNFSISYVMSTIWAWGLIVRIAAFISAAYGSLLPKSESRDIIAMGTCLEFRWCVGIFICCSRENIVFYCLCELGVAVFCCVSGFLKKAIFQQCTSIRLLIDPFSGS